MLCLKAACEKVALNASVLPFCLKPDLQLQYELRKMQLACGLPAGKFCEEKTKPLKHTAGYLSVIL